MCKGIGVNENDSSTGYMAIVVILPVLLVLTLGAVLGQIAWEIGEVQLVTTYLCDPSGPHITEARSEWLNELKLVRKPPKVSRGYGEELVQQVPQGSQIS